MTTTTTNLPSPPPPVPAAGLAAPVEVHPVTQGRVLRSEWIKLRTLRSTIIVLALTIVAIIGIGSLVSHFALHHNHGAFNPIDRSLAGVNIGQLTIGVLGILVITGEYSTGMIRATFGAVPKRLPVLWAKLVIFGAVTFVVCLVSSFCAFLAGQALLDNRGVSLSSPGALRAVFGVALYLTVVGLLAVAIGFIIRNTAGGIATLFGILLILPGLSNLLPSNWQNSVVPYFPSNAGQAIYTQHADQTQLHPWAGFALFVGYAAAAVIIAAITVRRRDA